MKKTAGQILRQRLRETFRSKDRAVRKSQTDLARILRISQGWVSKKLLQTNGADFELHELDGIAAFLGIPVPMLFIDPDNPEYPFERRVSDRRKPQPREDWPSDHDGDGDRLRLGHSF